MIIQKAAHQILEEEGKPISSKEIARIALERGLVISIAKNPIQSHSQSIEKNIRDGDYNVPKLVFIQHNSGRLIGLPAWTKKNITLQPKSKRISIEIPTELEESIQLAYHAGIKNTFEETVVSVLEKGLLIIAPKIKEGMAERLKKLYYRYKKS